LRVSIPSWLVELNRALDRRHPLYKLLQDAGPELPAEPWTVRLIARLFAFTAEKEVDRDLTAIKFAARELPSAKEGQRLKQWLLHQSLKPNDRQQTLDLTAFFLNDERSKAFPELDNIVSKRLRDLWISDADTLFEMIEKGKAVPAPQFDDMLHLLAREAPSDVLSQDSNSAWSGRMLLAEVRPALLLEADLSLMPTEVLTHLAGISLKHEDQAGDWLLKELFDRAPEAASLRFLDSHKGVALDVFVSTAISSDSKSSIHPDWRKEFRPLAAELLDRAMKICKTTMSLCKILVFLDWPEDPATLGGANQWKNFFKNAEDDAPLRQRQRLYAMVLNIAFRDASKASVFLFEHVAPSVSQWMEARELEHDVEVRALSNVQYYFTIPSWDYCKRMKRSLRESYEKNRLGEKNWYRLESRL
jgi:hypothetical protein